VGSRCVPVLKIAPNGRPPGEQAGQASVVGEQIRTTLGELRQTWSHLDYFSSSCYSSKKMYFWNYFRSQLDANGDGSLTAVEVTRSLVQSGGLDVKREDIERYMAIRDSDGDGVLDFTEFMEVWLLNDYQIPTQSLRIHF
jgi:hypothetical protein